LSNQVDLNLLINGWWGGQYDGNLLTLSVSGASNIVFGGNPVYTVASFLTMYPKFGPSDYFVGGIPKENPTGLWAVPEAIIQIYINLAQSCVQSLRWGIEWPIAMAWFIAHFCTLWLRSEGNPGGTAGQIAASGLESGIKASKSAGGVSVGIETVSTDLEGWGAFKETTYGVQYATRANSLVAAMMWVW
jgi:hypothetical protein